jgi:hypothetical protein
MCEVWKTIDNFSDYEISSFGNVKNKITNYIFKPCIKAGYLGICLKDDNGNKRSFKIHRLVALSFIPNPENKYSVNHKDHNKVNNNINNLEWATSSEQNYHRRKPVKEVQELVSSRAVWRIDIESNEKIEYYKTLRFASQWVFDHKLTSVNEFNNGNNIKTRICAVAQGRRKIAFGYKWKYCDENENKYKDEVWKDIPDHYIRGTIGYKISNYGRIRNHKGRISEGRIHLSGYVWVDIYPNSYQLHRLVAMVFIPNPENKEQVNHIDGNKQNANVNNLEWNTNQENQIHKINSGLSNLTKKVVQYDLKMNKMKEYISITEAEKQLKIYNIGRCCNNKQKTTGGFIFKFI